MRVRLPRRLHRLSGALHADKKTPVAILTVPAPEAARVCEVLRAMKAQTNSVTLLFRHPFSAR